MAEKAEEEDEVTIERNLRTAVSEVMGIIRLRGAEEGVKEILRGLDDEKKKTTEFEVDGRRVRVTKSELGFDVEKFEG